MTETQKQAVERLKKNEDHIILADMDDVDREILGKVGWSNCQILSDNSEGLYWGNLAGQNGHFYISHIYRIRPDYQSKLPKSEYENCEIFKVGNTLRYKREYLSEQLISNVINEADFRGFHDIAGPMCGFDVAEKHSKGFHVVARFERSKP